MEIASKRKYWVNIIYVLRIGSVNCYLIDHIIELGGILCRKNQKCHDKKLNFLLSGLSLHLNHLVASCMANYNWPFGTLPFGLLGQIWTQGTLRHILGPILVIFWNVNFWRLQGRLSTVQKMGGLRNQSFLDEEWSLPPYWFSLGGEGQFVCQSKHLRGCYSRWKSSTTFLTHSWRIKAHLLLMYCIKNVSIGVA